MAANVSLPFLDADGEKTTTGSIIDVVRNYSWTVSNVDLAREECPRIIIKEYQQSTASIRQSMEFLAGIGTQAVNAALNNSEAPDPYEGLYQVDENIRGNTYVLPYFNQYHHTTSNNWGSNKGSVPKLVEKGLGAIATVGKVIYPSAGIEGAKAWEGSSPTEYTFTFQLLNTVSWEKALMNKNFIKAIINNNLKDKMNFLATRPPAICKVSIPGMRGATVAVLSTINVANIGQMNFYKSTKAGGQLSQFGTGNYTVQNDGLLPEPSFNFPDAYEVSITVQELITESRQIFNGALRGGKVFSTVKPSGQLLKETVDKLTKAAKESIG